MVYFTLVISVHFPLVKLRVVVCNNYLWISCQTTCYHSVHPQMKFWIRKYSPFRAKQSFIETGQKVISLSQTHQNNSVSTLKVHYKDIISVALITRFHFAQGCSILSHQFNVHPIACVYTFFNVLLSRVKVKLTFKNKRHWLCLYRYIVYRTKQ